VRSRGASGSGPTAIALATILGCCAAHAESTVDADLRKAVEAGNGPAIEQLIAAGADTYRADALLAAVRTQQRDALLLLLRRGADPNAWTAGRLRLPAGAEGSPVYEAARSGNRAFLEILIHHGAKVDAAARDPGREGETPLLVAARRAELTAARLLLESGAGANEQAASGDTALHAAIWAGSNAPALVKLLLSHGADPDLRNAQGKSARTLAYAFGSPELMDMIDAAKPVGAFERPGDSEHIATVLAAKARCDLAIPGFEPRTRATYRRWRAARKTVIERIEASDDFRSLRRQIEQASRAQAANTQAISPDDMPSSQALQEVCESELVAEFRDPRRR
jgi:ankyrin repeat protein